MTGSRAFRLPVAFSVAVPVVQMGDPRHSGNLTIEQEVKARAEAVIHCAFDHDFSNFVANCEKDRRAIRAPGEGLAGSAGPLVITSGTGMGRSRPGKPATEDVVDVDNPNPRVASEMVGAEMSEAGVTVVVVRLPQVHDTRKQGFVTPFIDIARQKGVCAYVGGGLNRWPAAHVLDVARVCRLAVEQGKAGERFNAVDEESVSAGGPWVPD